jgi:DNA-3-methyladenine glycosylase II
MQRRLPHAIRACLAHRCVRVAPVTADSTEAALKHLRRVDPAMKALIRQVGPCLWQVRPERAPYESLIRAVAHQQLHGKAAETILGRFVALTPKKKFPTAKDISAMPPELLRSVGFSGAKAAAIADIAQKTSEGVVPTARVISKLDDEEIINRLTQVRGVGRWTVEMLLMFQLGRPDVLPADDFGVRNGFAVTYGLAEMPKPKALLAHGELWRPFRSVAAWYLWRAADRAKAAKAAIQ